ncbi:hypothetical protein QE428_002612 [Microbacterium sp. SORGH_AS 505]|uniref:hypothetical protein n=1 Tax=Microbacterium sp. SORGH_AS_0505 TaxID=3041770 RepID=UPI00278A3A95|nr:hypothetical protein [Microbacterium sp. SORGH_AS_0505]MDQ1127579.1 hypothetical protein [Microbacterium sp. SORGH_AS_0505]
MAAAGAKRIVVERSDGKWGWQLIGDNGYDIIATDGGQGYEKEDTARAMADKIISGHYADAKKLISRQKR